MKNRFLLLILLIFSISAVNAQSLKRVSNKAGKFGYCNAKGDTIIACKYDKTFDFVDGFALVKNNPIYKILDQNGVQKNLNDVSYDGSIYFNFNNYAGTLPLVIDTWTCSFINESGSVVLSLPYRDAEPFYSGKAKVYKDSQYNYINTKGELQDEWKSIVASPYSVYNGTKYAFIDSKGKFLTEFIYDLTGYFSEGLCYVGNYDKNNNSIVNYGFIDEKCKLVIDMNYDYAESFYNGLAKVEKDGNSFFINTKGEKLTGDFQQIYSNYNGGFIAQKNDKWAILDKNYNAISDWYDEIVNFYDGFYSYKKDDLLGILNKEGKIVVQNKYFYIGYFYEGIASVSIDSNQDNVADTYGYIDSTGKVLLEPIYDYAGDFANGFAIIGVTEISDYSYFTSYLYGFVDKTGKVIAKPQYNYAYGFINDYAIVGKYNSDDYITSYGMLNTKGVEAIGLKYSYLGSFYEGLAYAQKDGKYGFINTKGETVIDFVYTTASDFMEGYAVVSNDLNEDYNYDYFFIDNKGNKLNDLTFSNAYSFYDGLAQVFYESNSQAYNDYSYEYEYDYDYSYSIKSNFINKQGKLLSNDTLDYVDYYSNQDLIIVGKKDDNGKFKYTYLDKKGNKLFDFKPQIAYFDEFPVVKNTDDDYVTTYALANKKGDAVSEYFYFIDKFYEGFAIVQNSNIQNAFINSKGEVISEYYEKVNHFEKGKAKVYKDEKISYIDATGKVLEPFKYEEVDKTTFYKIIKYKNGYSIVNLKDELLTGEVDSVIIYSQETAKYLINNLIGFYNVKTNNNVSFSEIGEFKNNLAKAKNLGKYGFVDSNFEWKIKAEYDLVSDFENDKAKVVKDAKNNIIDKNGDLQSSWTWESSAKFVTFNSLKFVEWNNKYALLDKKDNIISEWFYYITKSNDNVIVKKQYNLYTIDAEAELTAYYGTDSKLTINSQYVDDTYLYGVLDENGNIVVDYKYDYIGSYSNGFALAQNYGYDDYNYTYNYEYQFIDEKGKVLNDKTYTYAKDFSGGLAVVQNDNLYGYIDENGKLVIDYQFYDAYSFNSGLAKVANSSWNYAYIDRTGKIIIDYSNNSFSDFYGDFAIRTTYNNYEVANYSFVDRTGAIISENYDLITDLNSETYICKKNKNGALKSALFNKELDLISDWFDYIQMYSYSEPIFAIKNNKVALLNYDGSEVSDKTEIENYINSYYYFDEELAPFSMDNKDGVVKYGFINTNGEIVIKAEYDYVQAFKNGFAIVQNYSNDSNYDYYYEYSYNYVYNIIDKNGKLLLNDWASEIANLSNGMYKISTKENDILKIKIVNQQFETVIDNSEMIYELSDNYLLVLQNDKFNLYNENGTKENDKEILKQKLSEQFTFNNGLAVFSVLAADNYNYKHGYLNTEGEIVIKPQFTYAYDFSDDLALVAITDDNYYTKYGYIDLKGNIVIDYQYDYAYDFSNGLAKVGIYNVDTYETLYGFINKKGELVIDYQFAETSDFVDGIAIVSKNFDFNKMSAFIDNTGKVISNWYDILIDFKNEYALALKYDHFLLIDKSGKEIENLEKVKQFLSENYNFINNVCVVTKPSTYNYNQPNSVLINSEGKTISEWYYSIGAFKDGMALVSADLNLDYYNEYGYINEAGKLVIDIQYAYADDFSNGFARIGIPNQDYSYNYGLIDKTGEYVIEPSYSDLRSFSEGYAVVGNTENYISKYGMIDEKGKLVIDYKYDYLGDLHDGLAYVYKYNSDDYTYKYGFINKKGKLVIDYKFDYVSDFSEGLAVVSKVSANNNYDYDYEYSYEDEYSYNNYTYGFIDKKGKLVVDYQYDYASNFSDGMAVVGKYIDGVLKYAYIDKTGKITSDWSDILYSFVDGYSIKLVDKQFVLIDKNMNQVENKDKLKEILVKNLYFSEGMALVLKDGKYGFVNQDGKVVIDFQFTYAGDFYSGSAYVEIDYVGYYVDKNGVVTKY